MAKRKTVKQIQDEVRKMRRIEKTTEYSGIQASAHSFALALEWALGDWGMDWSKWLRACQRSNRNSGLDHKP